jgi:hypothetical protein
MPSYNNGVGRFESVRYRHSRAEWAGECYTLNMLAMGSAETRQWTIDGQ